jgi:hypothetical protein
MSRITDAISREPVRAYLYSALTALLPLLAAFGVDLTDAQSATVLGLAYALLIGAAELSRSKVTPV